MADIVAHYGGSGRPEPGDERRVTVSYTCGACGLHVSPGCEWCRHCGERFDGVGLDDSGEEVSNEQWLLQ